MPDYHFDGGEGLYERERQMRETQRRYKELSETPEIVTPDLVPVSIYILYGDYHEQVEQAVVELLDAAGLQVDSRDEPIDGSWFRRMRASAVNAAHSSLAKEVALSAAHAADTRLVLAQDAAVTATLLQNLGPVITALQPTRDAVVRVGAVLIVKVDWVVTVCQLTAAQQLELNHNQGLAAAPQKILDALNAETIQAAAPPALE